MSDRRIKDAISGFLRDRGFQVTQIAEGERRTPDLLAIRGQRYLIEIKTREDDPAALAERAERLGVGEIVQSGAPFTPQNTMSRIVRDGVDQLDAHPVQERDFCLLWLLAVGSDSVSQYEQFLATLYGLSDVVGPDSLPLKRNPQMSPMTQSGRWPETNARKPELPRRGARSAKGKRSKFSCAFCASLRLFDLAAAKKICARGEETRRLLHR
jgi:Holliday junction resolvase hjc